MIANNIIFIHLLVTPLISLMIKYSLKDTSLNAFFRYPQFKKYSSSLYIFAKMSKIKSVHAGWKCSILFKIFIYFVI